MSSAFLKVFKYLFNKTYTGYNINIFEYIWGVGLLGFCYAVIIIYAIFVFCSFCVYINVFHSDRKTQIDPYNIDIINADTKIDRSRINYIISEIINMPCERVSISSHDGLRLCGKYFHNSDGAPLEILFHGYKSASARDLCGYFRVTKKMGHNILLVDERAQGESEGSVISFGIKERYDCADWVNYAVKRFGDKQKIVLVGASMGAATVLMASSLDLPKNVVGIVADSAYSSPKDIIVKVGCEKKFPMLFVSVFAESAAHIFGRFDLCESSAVKEVEKCDRPILLLHGANDGFVPSYMSRKIYAACGSKKKMTVFNNNGHCAGFIFNTEKYVSEIRDFCSEILGSA